MRHGCCISTGGGKRSVQDRFESGSDFNTVRQRGPFRLMLLLAVWSLGIVAGFFLLWRYGREPTGPLVAPVKWPLESRIERLAGQPTLLVFAHPKCPCTLATVGELQRIVARCQGRMETLVVLVKPAGVAEQWEQGPIQRAAEAIPGVGLLTDPGGVEAARFGAVRSGAALLYDAQGQLRFAGGITLSRGHRGDNPGMLAVVDWLQGRRQTCPGTEVFGCPLVSTEQ